VDEMNMSGCTRRSKREGRLKEITKKRGAVGLEMRRAPSRDQETRGRTGGRFLEKWGKDKGIYYKAVSGPGQTRRRVESKMWRGGNSEPVLQKGLVGERKNFPGTCHSRKRAGGRGGVGKKLQGGEREKRWARTRRGHCAEFCYETVSSQAVEGEGLKGGGKGAWRKGSPDSLGTAV